MMMTDSLWQDIQYGFVQMTRRFKLSLAIIFCIALGIGPNTTLFSMFNSLLLNEPAVMAPEQLVSIHKYRPGKEGLPTFTYPDLVDFNDQVSQLEGILGFSYQSASVSMPEGPEMLPVEMATSNFFDLLGVQPLYGETFHRQTSQAPGSMPVVVLSYSFWQQRFAEDKSVVGRKIKLNGSDMTIIGVMPADFTGALGAFGSKMWLPMVMMNIIDPDSPARLTSRNDNWIIPVARLVENATLESVNQEMATIDSKLQAQYPETNEGNTHRAVPYSNIPFIPETARSMVVFGASLVVGLILLVACSSVAALLLSRATERRQEISVRLALGAPRYRVVRQLMIENLMLALVASVVGFIFSLWAVVVFKQSLPAEIPFQLSLDPSLDANMLLYTLGAAFLSSLLFGLVPALQATKTDLFSALKEQPQAGGTQVQSSKLRSFFLITQFSLSVFLLVIAGLTIKGLHNSVNINPGFDADNLLTFKTDLSLYGYLDDEKTAYSQRLNHELASLAGVESVVISRTPPMSGDKTATLVSSFNDAMEAGEETRTFYSIITPGYFATIGAKLLRGREFTLDDQSYLSPKVIINQAMAKTLFVGTDAMGKYLSIPSSDDAFEIIAIAENIANSSIGSMDEPYMYIPLGQRFDHGLVYVVRTEQDPALLIDNVKAKIAELNPDIALNMIETMTDTVSRSLFSLRALAIATSGLGLLALLLATIGTYGVVSYSVKLRQHEIGVRLSLGAQPRALVFMLMSSGLKLIIIGCVLGLGLSFVAGELLSPMLSGVGPRDPLVFILVPLFMLSLSCLAIYFPARKTSRVDPMLALRYE
jgi:predicted permease